MSGHFTISNLNLGAATKEIAVEALRRTGSIVEAAQLLGITRRQLRTIIIKHRIEWPRGYQMRDSDSKPETQT